MPDMKKSGNEQLILVAGNDEIINLSVEKYLQEAGYISTNSATESLTDLIPKICPDLIVVTTACSSGRSGSVILKKIRSLPESRSTPLLFAIGSGEKGLLRSIFNDAGGDFVNFPIEREQLLFRVGQMLKAGRAAENHKEIKEHLENAQRIANLGHWEWHPESGIFRGSEEISKILGLKKGTHCTTFESFLLVILPEDRGFVEEGLRSACQSRSGFCLECRIIGQEGAPHFIKLHGCIEKSAGSRNDRVVGIMQDLTVISRMEDHLEMLKEAVDSLPIGITISDTNGKIVYSNSTEATMHGYTVEELVGRQAGHFARENKRNPFTLERLKKMSVWKRESVNVKKNGEDFPVQLTSIAVKNNRRYLGIVTTCEDISERKEAEKQIYQLAHLDPLTGLPNRRMFQDRLRHALAIARREEGKVCLAYLDLDNFKDINDTQGHDFGDKFLKDVASRLSAVMRESDTIARLGGDEFVVIFVSVKGEDNFTTAAQRMLSVFCQPFEIDNKLVYSSISIGMAIFPEDGVDVEGLLKSADTAMYRVKQEGKGNFRFFSSEMNEHIMRRVAMESALRSGLPKGEFFLHYQPQWDLSTKRMIGVEALLRWQSSDFGLMLPGEFINYIEDSGLIFSVGEWVMRTACLQARHWAASGCPDLKVAINISGKQLKHADFHNEVARIIRETGVNPENIELEFTESVIMEHAERTCGVLLELKKMGLKLSIDDFGTGYSSLNYLKNFPIDRIKIDKTFVNDITRSADDAAIVQAIISLASVLRLTVIAEGVETEEQLHCLQELGCNEIQGFLLAEPMSVKDLAAILPPQQTDW